MLRGEIKKYYLESNHEKIHRFPPWNQRWKYQN